MGTNYCIFAWTNWCFYLWRARLDQKVEALWAKSPVRIGEEPAMMFRLMVKVQGLSSGRFMARTRLTC